MNATVRLWRIIIFMLGISFALEELAYATPVTIQISGTVTSASGTSLSDMVHVGNTFTGTYTYNSSTPDSDALPNRGNYQHGSPSFIRIALGEYDFKTSIDNGFQMRIWNNFTDSLGNSYDYYYILGFGNSPIANTSVFGVSWSLKDKTLKALSSDTLPVAAPILSNWKNSYFQINSPNSFCIEGNITQAVLVPEPATLTLLGIGGLLIRRK